MTFKYLSSSGSRSATHVHNRYGKTTYDPTSFHGHDGNDDTVNTTRSVRYDVRGDAYEGTPCNDSDVRRYAPGPWD